MRTQLKTLLLMVAMLACPIVAQKDQTGAKIVTSGTTVTLDDYNGSGSIIVAIRFVGTPTTFSGVTSGCMRNGGACDVLDTYTGTTSSNRQLSKAGYDYYTFTATWTGTITAVYADKTGIRAALKSGGGGSTLATGTTGKYVYYTGTATAGPDPCLSTDGTTLTSACNVSVTGNLTTGTYVSADANRFLANAGMIYTQNGIQQYSNVANGSLFFSQTDGYNVLSSNVADSKTAVTSKNTNASSTGHIHDFEDNTGVVAFVSRGGGFTGTSLILPSQTANTFFAAPIGTAGVPSFRGIVAADINGAAQTLNGVCTTTACPGKFTTLNSASYTLGSDLTIMPVPSSQSRIASYHALLLSGTDGTDYSNSPVAVGGIDDYGVIVAAPNSAAVTPLVAQLGVRAKATVPNILQLEQIGGAVVGKVSYTGTATLTQYATTTNCSSAASPAVCGSAAAGSVVVAAAATTVVVNDTAVTANSQIMLTFDSSLGTKLGVTCNTTPAVLSVSARVAGTSFTVTSAAPTTNPDCLSFLIVN